MKKFEILGEKFHYLETLTDQQHPELADCIPVTLPYHFRWDVGEGSFIEFRILPGLTHDYATVPWWLRSVIGKHGPHACAAVVHDAMYINHKRVRDGLTPLVEYLDGRVWRPLAEPLSRAEADRMFLDAMMAIRDKMNLFQVRSAYRAVRWFGGNYYNGELKPNHFRPEFAWKGEEV